MNHEQYSVQSIQCCLCQDFLDQPPLSHTGQKAYCDLAGSQEVGNQQWVDGTWIQNSWGGLRVKLYISQFLDVKRTSNEFVGF